MPDEKPAPEGSIAQWLAQQEPDILAAWLEVQVASLSRRADLISEADLRQESKELLEAFTQAIAAEDLPDLTSPAFQPLLRLLEEMSRSQAAQGFSPSEMAAYVFGLKDILLTFLQEHLADQPVALNREFLRLSQVLDKLGLYTFEVFARSREELIAEQSEAILEMASPALRIWDDVVLLPLVGVIDTARAQTILDSLLCAIAETEALVAILDVTGVPIIDTRVAQHLLTAVEGAHMLGAETIITGVSVETAKTLTKLRVHLGQVITRGSLRAGLRLALKLVGEKGQEEIPWM